MSQLELAYDIGYITKEELDTMDEQASVIQKMLSGIYKSYSE